MIAATAFATGCTRTVHPDDLCELVESHETGAPRNAYVACGERGEALPCEGELMGQAASRGAIEAALSACIGPSGPHPTGRIGATAGHCDGDSGALVYELLLPCEVSTW